MSVLLMVSGLLCIGIISVSSGVVYVRSGEDITGCGMTCSGPDEVTRELLAECGGTRRKPLIHVCNHKFTKSHDPRILLDTRNGCWKLTPARKDDTCVYKVWSNGDPDYLVSSTDIRVMDPIVISNITNNGSRLGRDVAVSIHYTGEESAVTWEVDGEPLPERYRLIDDNRTLIIPGVQRGDTQRTFRVTITNPVSNETRSYRLKIGDPIVISNITNNGSRLGQDVAVSIHYTGEESAVTWEVDGEPLPERYRLIDDNRTLIIPGVQRGDTQRTFRVTITNPIYKEIRSYQLNYTLFFEELETKDSDPYRRRTGLIGVVIIVLGLSAFIIYQICSKKKRNPNDPEDGAGATLKDGSLPVTPHNGSQPSINHDYVSVTESQPTNKLEDSGFDEPEENVKL